jgi:HK97 family phage major capsid protein
MSTVAENALTPEAVVQFDLAQCKAEAAARWQKSAAIHAKYPRGLTIDDNADDFNEDKRLRGELDLIEARSAKLEEAGDWQRRVKSNVEKYSRPANPHMQPDGDPQRGGHADTIEMFGSQFVRSDEYKRILDSGILHNPSSRVDFGVQLKGSLLNYLMTKALAYSASGVGGPLIRNERVAGLDLLFRQPSFLDLIPTATTTSNMIEYYEMTTSTNNAAFVAEASATTGTTGTKPEGAIGWTLRTSPVSTVAEWVPVTNQFLADAPAVEGLIREQLLTHLDLALETGILTGNGTPPNLTGVLNTANIQTLGLHLWRTGERG